MSIATEQAALPPQQNTVVNQVPIGSIAPVFRSGDAYKAVGEVVSRAAYPELSTAFPHNGSVTTMVSPALMGQLGLKSLAGGNGVLVAVGPTATCSVSTDGGVTWFSYPMGGSPVGQLIVTYGNGQFLVLGRGFAATSPDGVNWTQRTAPAPSTDFLDVIYGGGKYVATAATSANCYTSPDGITWTTRTLPSSDSWSGIAYGAGIYVAVNASYTMATSTDGITWTARAAVAAGANADRIAFGNGVFVLGGNSTLNLNFATSPDGINWTRRVSPSNSNIYTLAFADNLFVGITANGFCLTSSDGVVWSARPMPQNFGYGLLAFVNGRFIAAQINATVTIGAFIFAESKAGAANLTDSLYLSGTAGQFIRVK